MSVANLQQQLFKANRTYKAHFVEGLNSGRAKFQGLIDLVAMKEPSTGSHNEYNFNDDVPAMVEWTGDRPSSKLGVDGFILKNKPYVNGVDIDRDDLEDDNLGMYNRAIKRLGEKASHHQWIQLRNLLNGGFTANGYDGVTFFNNVHAHKGTAQDNLTTGALSSTTFAAAVLLLENMTTTEGEELALHPSHLIVSPSDREMGMQILQAQRLASGASNVWFGASELVVVQGVTAGYWFVADLSTSIRPLVHQMRRKTQLTTVTDPKSPDVYNRRTFRYGADYRGRAGYGYFQTIVGSVG